VLKNRVTSFVPPQFSRPDSEEIRRQPGDVNFPWFALRVRSRHENTVAAILGGKGYEWFVPLYKSRRLWSDRIKEIQLSLIPGYVFCRFDPHGSRFLRHRRVVSVVGIGKCPIPIDDAEIAAIQAAVRSGLPSRPWPFLQIGQRVRVEHGPLCGLEGILLYVKGQRRLVLSVTLSSDQLPSRWTMPGSSPLPNRIEFALNDMCSARGSFL